MARYSYIGSGPRILLLLLLVIFLGVVGFVWFDYLGLIDGKDVLGPILGLLGFHQRKEIVDVENPLLLERERILMQQEALSLLEEEIEKREEEVFEKETEVTQMASDLEAQEEALRERENSFNERIEATEDRYRNLEQTSEYLVSMPPQKAVEILLGMEDTDIIDIFRVTEERAQEEDEVSLVAYWLSLMPGERAAELNRKMARQSQF